MTFNHFRNAARKEFLELNLIPVPPFLRGH
jgi:hypothetical protein